MMSEVDNFLAEWRSDADYITAHTSGSTGRPKTIHLSKDMVRRSAQRTIEFFGLNASSRLHLCLSTDYIAGKMMVVRSEECGCLLTYETPSNRVLETADLSRPIDLLAVVPSQMYGLLDHPELLAHVRHVIIGGSALPKAMVERILALGIDAWETYGMTETASHVALRPVGREWFMPLPGVAFSQNGSGCLVINLDEDGRFTTLDIVKIVSGGAMRILGRVDFVINSGGIKIHPEQVEKQIEPLMGERCYYLTSRPHPKWGREPVLMVEGYMPPSEREELLAKIKGVLSSYEAPKEIICVPRFERTRSGKVRRVKKIVD